MSTPQERVYEVLDVATKPAQWFIGGVKLLFLLLIGTGIIISIPVSNYLNHQPVTVDMFVNIGLVLFAWATLIVAPAYFIGFGLLTALAFGWFVGDPVRSDLALKYTYSGGVFKFYVFLWLLVGFSQAVIRHRLRKQREQKKASYDAIYVHDLANKYRAEMGLEPLPPLEL